MHCCVFHTLEFLFPCFWTALFKVLLQNREWIFKKSVHSQPYIHDINLHLGQNLYNKRRFWRSNMGIFKQIMEKTVLSANENDSFAVMLVQWKFFIIACIVFSNSEFWWYFELASKIWKFKIRDNNFLLIFSFVELIHRN